PRNQFPREAQRPRRLRDGGVPRGETLARPAGWYQPGGIRRERLKPSRFTVVPVRIGIFVFDGVEELDAVGVYEVLAKAKQLHPPLDLTVRFRALKEQITGALAMKFLAHDARRDLSDLNCV